MKRHAEKKDFMAAASATWGVNAPDWVRRLAAEATSTTLSATARRVGYSVATLSHVLANNYAGDMGRVEKAVRGSLMGETVECPVVGEITLNRCLFEQARTVRAATAIGAQIFRKCRGIGTERCPHSMIDREGRS